MRMRKSLAASWSLGRRRRPAWNLGAWAARGTVAPPCLADLHVFAVAIVVDAGSEKETVDADAGAGDSTIALAASDAGS